MLAYKRHKKIYDVTVSMLCALKEKAFVYENLFFVRVVNRYYVTSKYPLFISLTNMRKIPEIPNFLKNDF